ncbi:hypothetical protein BGZ72_003788 [Mortierella alpina]|nr:hypothetical protein BGZ72_003788 [Mortierella alpina]
MIMAPVSSSPGRQAGAPGASDKETVANALAKKRTSVHIIEAVTGEHNNTQNNRANSALRSATTDDDSQSSGSCSGSSLSEFSHITTPSSHSVSSTRHQSLSSSKQQDVPDLQLLKSLASFLKGEADDEDAASSIQGNLFSRAASPSNDAHTDNVCDLVVHVRDFAYPKSHPNHFGNYPPEPEYEESDIEEEEEESDYYTHNDAVSSPSPKGQDRTQGPARGLYDFDAETSSELSFKEGDCLWIHCRRFPGWFLGEMAGVQGLVPENYVQML